MWQRNNGENELEILQNRFTAYLMAAIKRHRQDYIKKLAVQDREVLVEEVPETGEEQDMFRELPIMMQLEDNRLFYALKTLNERERRIFLGRVLDEKSFLELAQENGLGYKGAAAIYYRTIRKMEKGIGRARRNGL